MARSLKGSLLSAATTASALVQQACVQMIGDAGSSSVDKVSQHYRYWKGQWSLLQLVCRYRHYSLHDQLRSRYRFCLRRLQQRCIDCKSVGLVAGTDCIGSIASLCTHDQRCWQQYHRRQVKRQFLLLMLARRYHRRCLSYQLRSCDINIDCGRLLQQCLDCWKVRYCWWYWLHRFQGKLTYDTRW